MDPNVDQLLQSALQHHRAGRAAQAEVLARQVLRKDPRQADALNLLGIIAAQAGRYDLAAESLHKAIAVRPGFLEAYNNLGNVLRDQGRLDDAEAACRRAIALRAGFPEAWNNLGNVLRDKGQFDEAEAACRRAIALRPNFAEAYGNLGSVLKDKGRLDEAVAAHRQAMTLGPNNPQAHNNLGNVLMRQGRLDEAVAAYNQALALWPNFPHALVNHGKALKDQGRLEEAIAAFRRATGCGPNVPEAFNSLGDALNEAGLFEEAVAACARAIALRPDYPEPHNNLGNALLNQGRLEEAVAAYRQAIALKSNFPEACWNLGNALTGLRRLDEAIAVCRQGIALRPDFAGGYNNLGNALRDRGLLDEAAAAFHQAIALDPGYAEAHNNLASALTDMGQLDESLAAYRRAIAIKPDYVDAHSNLLLALHYHGGCDAAAIAGEHRCWSRQHADSVMCASKRKSTNPAGSHANIRDPDRRLRIGYVSPDFKQHPVAPMVLPLLANHDRRSFEIFCYAQVKRPDAVTGRFRATADQWRSTVGLSDEQMADLIREDQIDILVDLAGHTAGSRLLVFARKPAPVQVTRQGYPNTTGLTTIDYRMTDAYADPPGPGDALYSEQLVRLPQTNWIYHPPDDAPLPDHSAADRPVTFGCFNTFAKVTDPTLMLWSRILKEVPGSRLLLKALALTNPSTRQRVLDLFVSAGITPAQLELRGPEPRHGDHLALYNRVDIALDPFPYHGTTTTCEALWMGVPVITLAGQTHVSRVGVSLLTNIGLAELIAEGPDEYVRIAADLAGNLRRLRDLHSTLRQKMENSPVMDAPGFARNVEAEYRQMWRTWCRT